MGARRWDGRTCSGRHVVGLTGPVGRPTLCPPRYSPLGLTEVEVADLDAFDRFEAAGWETTAAAYDHYWPRLTNRLNDHLLDAVGAGPHARLLDVACGPGYLTGQASDRGATVTGIDVAKAMVEMARRRCPRIEFRQADAQALPFPEASFHAIVGNLAIPHLARPERAAAEFHRVLASNGRLALTTWDLPDRARLVGVLLEAVREIEVIPPETVPAGPDFFRFADNAEFNALLAGQGFTEVEVRSIAFMHPVGSPDELWDGLLRGTVRTSAIVRGQPDDVVARIRAGFDRRMQAYRAGRTYEIPVAFKLASGRQS
jgi:SAM-dependent methyltransferase